MTAPPNTGAVHDPAAGPPRCQGADLPRGVLRPLWIGFAVIAVTLVAFLFWAGFAPLATSIPANGHLSARKPSYDLQHPFGGPVAEILVTEHARVPRGAVLLRLDVGKEVAELKEVRAILTPMVEERAALHAALNDTLPPEDETPTEGATTLAYDRMRNLQASQNMRVRMAQQVQDNYQTRAATLQASLQNSETVAATIQARLLQDESARTPKDLRLDDVDALRHLLLDVQSAIRSDRMELADLESRVVQAHLKMSHDGLAFRQKLLDRLAELEETIPQLRIQMLRLQDQINQAELRAPDAGVIARLHYDTPHMVVAPGDTVLTLARPATDQMVYFNAPAHAIDQLRAGMKGYLTLTSLPQRSHPRVRVTIRSLAPEARRNSDDQVIGYDGVAVMDTQDRDAVIAMGEKVSLSADMPITLVFTGRETTFGAYLMGPFWSFISKALQD